MLLASDNRRARFERWLRADVDGSSTAVFRLGFGLVVAHILWQLIRPGAGGRSGIELLWTGAETRWHFPYPYLTWLRPLPEPGTTALFWLALVAALLVAVGWCYRTAAVVLLVAFTYIWLMDASVYGNHFPLVWVFLVCLALVPAARCWSIDRWRTLRRDATSVDADPPNDTVPRWVVLLLRFQTGVVYFYGGVSKLHADWLAGEPLRMWLAEDRTVAPIAAVFGTALADQAHTWLSTEWAAMFFSYGGLAFDLSIPFLLAWRWTRPLALVVATGFHVFNYFCIAHVGIVAVLAFWATLTFCRPDWPRRLLRLGSRRPLGTTVDGVAPAPALAPSRPLLAGLVMAWMVFQVAWPLRHFAIAGNPYWTDEGTRASWFLMTRNKVGALAQFRVVDPAIATIDTPTGQYIDWTAWRGMRPPVEISEIDARTVDWAKLPEVFITFEPVVGERLFYNPRAAGLESFGGAQARANELWQKQFGRPAALTPTELLPRLIDEQAAGAIVAARDKQRGAEDYLRLLAVARTRVRELEDPALDAIGWRTKYLELVEACARLASSQDYGGEFLAGMARAAPLALQGYAMDGFRPLLLNDAPLIRPGRAAAWRIERKGGLTPSTYSDLRYLEARWLRDLPSVVALVDERGETAFLWNYTHELNDHQIQALEVLPPLAGPLAAHIADWWETHQQRRPQVYGSALVALNRRPLLPVLDHTIDIAAEPYRVLRHNRWITPRPPDGSWP